MILLANCSSNDDRQATTPALDWETLGALVRRCAHEVFQSDQAGRRKLSGSGDAAAELEDWMTGVLRDAEDGA